MDSFLGKRMNEWMKNKVLSSETKRKGRKVQVRCWTTQANAIEGKESCRKEEEERPSESLAKRSKSKQDAKDKVSVLGDVELEREDVSDEAGCWWIRCWSLKASGQLARW